MAAPIKSGYIPFGFIDNADKEDRTTPRTLVQRIFGTGTGIQKTNRTEADKERVEVLYERHKQGLDSDQEFFYASQGRLFTEYTIHSDHFKSS